MALPKEVLEWYAQLQADLKENFGLDTTKKTDMGRLRCMRLYEVTNDTEDVQLDPAEFELRPLPYGELTDGLVTVKDMYATFPLDEAQMDYRDPLPEDPEKSAKAMIDRQKTFDVKRGPDGEWRIDTAMSESELLRIYRDAKEGRLYANAPGCSIISEDTPSRMISVAGDGRTPVYIQTYFSNMRSLPDEKFIAFYESHPELRGKRCGDPDVAELADLELNEYRRLEDPQLYRRQAMKNMEAMLGTANLDNEAITRGTFDVLFWQDAHEGLVPMDEVETCRIIRDIPQLLESAGITDVAVRAGVGLERFFIEEPDGTMKPLFDDLFALEGSEVERQATINRRVTDCVRNGELFVCAEGREGEPTFHRLRTDKSSDELIFEKVPGAEPRKPSGLERFFHWIYSGWCTNVEEYDRYQKDRARLEEALPYAYTQMTEMKAAIEEPKEKKEPRTEKRFEKRLADGILELLHEGETLETHRRTLGITPEKIMQAPEFRSFLQTPEAQTAKKNYLEDKPVRYSEFMPKLLKSLLPKKPAEKPAEQKAPAAQKKLAPSPRIPN